MYMYGSRPGEYRAQFPYEMPFPPFPPVYEAIPPAPPPSMYYIGARPGANATPITPHYQPYSSGVNYGGGGESFSKNQILGNFKTAEGYYDIDKMVQTFGQVMNTVNSAVPVFKQFGSFIGR